MAIHPRLNQEIEKPKENPIPKPKRKHKDRLTNVKVFVTAAQKETIHRNAMLKSKSQTTYSTELFKKYFYTRQTYNAIEYDPKKFDDEVNLMLDRQTHEYLIDLAAKSRCSKKKAATIIFQHSLLFEG